MPELGALPNLGFAHLAGVDPLTINNFIVPELHQSGISNSLFVLVHPSALCCVSPDFLSPGSLRSMSGNLAKFVAIRRTLSRVSKLGDHSLIPMNHSLIPISCAWRNSSQIHP